MRADRRGARRAGARRRGRRSGDAENVADRTIPASAMARRLAVRATVLLTAEATPVRSGGTDDMTTVVRGPTLIAMPTPITIVGSKERCDVASAHARDREECEARWQ